MPRPTRNALFVASLAKATGVMEVFLTPPHSFGLSEVVKATGLEKSAVQRILYTLHEQGWLQRHPHSRQYALSMRFVEGAFAHLMHDPLMIHATPHVISLSRELRETVNVARLDGSDIVYVNRLPAQRASYISTVVGRRIPALNCSAGRAALACRSVEEIAEACATWPLAAFRETTVQDRDLIRESVLQAKRDGYSITQEQLLANEIGIAAPVRDQNGQAIGAIQLSVSKLRWTIERVRVELLPSLVDVSKAINPPA